MEEIVYLSSAGYCRKCRQFHPASAARCRCRKRPVLQHGALVAHDSTCRPIFLTFDALRAWQSEFRMIRYAGALIAPGDIDKIERISRASAVGQGELAVREKRLATSPVFWC